MSLCPETLKNSIELIRKFELKDYEIINSGLCHYRFRLLGGVVERISIVEILSLRDFLKKQGHYKKAVSAEIIEFEKFKKIDLDFVRSCLKQQRHKNKKAADVINFNEYKKVKKI